MENRSGGDTVKEKVVGKIVQEETGVLVTAISEYLRAEGQHEGKGSLGEACPGRNLGERWTEGPGGRENGWWAAPVPREDVQAFTWKCLQALVRLFNKYLPSSSVCQAREAKSSLSQADNPEREMDS